MKRPATIAALLFISCAGDAPGPVGPIPSTLIVNQSQYTLSDLRVHKNPGYASTPNALGSPMEIDEQIVFYGEGSFYVTFMHVKYTGGPTLAYTMSEPIGLYRGQAYKLVLFDESFRLEDAEYVRVDQFDGETIGDPGPACEWLPRTETSTCRSSGL